MLREIVDKLWEYTKNDIPLSSPQGPRDNASLRRDTMHPNDVDEAFK